MPYLEAKSGPGQRGLPPGVKRNRERGASHCASKRPFSDGTEAVVFTPSELIERLLPLIPKLHAQCTFCDSKILRWPGLPEGEICVAIAAAGSGFYRTKTGT